MEEIQKGDLFLLGRNRLLCGDACSLIEVQKIMDGKQAELLFTDPPYNVNYIPENRDVGGRKKTELGGIMNDKGEFDYEKWFKILETGIVKGSIYITNIDRNYCAIYSWMNRHFKRNTSVLLWIKKNHVLSRTDYHKSYELIFYNRMPEGVWNGGRDQKAEWYIPQRPVNTYIHPTQKPLTLIKKAILNKQKPNIWVLT